MLLTKRYRPSSHYKGFYLCYSLFSFLQVKNLRSQVARGAIACIGDMFAFLGRDMEQVNNEKL